MRHFLIGMSGGLFRFERDSGKLAALMPATQPTAFAIDPSEPTLIYCATYNRGLWRSDDTGRSWLPVGTPQSYYGPEVDGALPERETTFVSVDPQKNHDGRHPVWIGTETSKLYRSDDHGLTFQLVNALDTLPSRHSWAYPPRPATHHVRWIAHGEHGQIYLSVEFGAFLRSMDGGKTFEDRRSDSPLDTHVLLTHPLAPRRIYGALGDGLMMPGRSFGESLDGGESWNYVSRGLEEMVYLYGMSINPSDPDDIRVAASPSPGMAHGRDWKAQLHDSQNDRQATSSRHPSAGPSSIFKRVGQAWKEDAIGFPRDHSLIPVLTADPHRPGYWFALSNLGLFEQAPGKEGWQLIANDPAWENMHPMSLLPLNAS
jgi:hypothetical protein